MSVVAYVFPGQGAQFEGMGKEVFASHEEARLLLNRANDLLGFDIGKVMTKGSAEDLKRTDITQPAIFIHSMAVWKSNTENINEIGAFAGHSLGEFSALVASGAIDFDSGLKLIAERAAAMQEACTLQEGTMAAVIGMQDEEVEEVCSQIEGVVPANYNSPGQIVISGQIEAIGVAEKELTEAGARKVVRLPVGGAFHSPLMKPAEDRLARVIDQTEFRSPIRPVYLNVTANATTDPQTIKKNLLIQLTAPVKWTQSIQKMAEDGIDAACEVGGKGGILTGLIKRINRSMKTEVL